MTKQEILSKLQEIPQVRDFHEANLEGEPVYYINIKTDEYNNQALHIMFQIVNDNFMKAQVILEDDEWFFGDPDEVRIYEDNEVQGRPKGVIQYLAAQIDKYYPEKNFNVEKGKYIFTLTM